MSIGAILTKHLPELVRGEQVNPTDEVLDLVWEEIKEDNAFAVSDALECWSTDDFDVLLEAFVKSGALDDATKLRKWTLACFRDYARAAVLGYESSIMAAHLHGVGLDNLPEYNAETASYV